MTAGRPNAFQLRSFSPRGYKRGRPRTHHALWWAVSHLVVQPWYSTSRIRRFALRLFGASIGERVLIRSRVRVHLPWKLSVGDDVWIGEGVWLLNLEAITIEQNVCLSQDAFLCTGSHDRFDPNFRYANAPIVIGAGSWVAARALVLPGARLPPGTFVSAGSRWPNVAPHD